MFKTTRKAAAFNIAFAAIAAGSVGFAPGVFAQDDEIEELVVTGSRLTRSNVTSSVPLVQTGSQETDSRGAARIEDVVNILSSPDTGTGNNNPYPGLFDVSRFLFAGINYKF